MPQIPYSIGDVFAEKQYAGNQLAVVHPGTQLSDEEMQTIAREFHFSETTFILSDTEHDGGWDVRIFTPAEEVPFAGHPTLGTAFIIQQEFIHQPVDQLTLHLKAGDIPVSFARVNGKPLLWMKQLEPAFGNTYDMETFAALLSLEPEQIDARWPIQTVSTGLPFIIVPLTNLAAVKLARIQPAVYARLIEHSDAKAVFIFCPEAYDESHQVNSRMFADFFDVPEDPATGSANGCLAAYLVQHRYFGNTQIDIQVEQGYEIQRPSVLHLRASQNSDQTIQIHVGGQVQSIAKGELLHI